MKKIKIMVAESDEHIRLVCRLRFDVYVGELKRSNYSYVDNVQRLLQDPLDATGVNIFAVDEEAWIAATSIEMREQAVVGAARVHVPMPEQYREAFGTNDDNCFPKLIESQEHFAFFSRFMVRATARGRSSPFELPSVANQLYEASARAALDAGALFLLLNCTSALVGLYNRVGFVRYRPAFFDQNMGIQVPMAVPLHDQAHLEACDGAAPFLAVLQSHGGSSRVGDGALTSGSWLAELRSRRHAVLIAYQLYSLLELRDYISKICPVELDSFSIYKNVTAAERGQMFALLQRDIALIDVPGGAMLSRIGEIRDESFLLLSGKVYSEQTGTTLEPGAVIGESAFLNGEARATTNRCTTPVVILVLSRIGFAKAMDALSPIAVKLLFNLSLQLTRKFAILSASSEAVRQYVDSADPSLPLDRAKLRSLVPALQEQPPDCDEEKKAAAIETAQATLKRINWARSSSALKSPRRTNIVLGGSKK